MIIFQYKGAVHHKTDPSSNNLQELLIPGSIRHMTTGIIGYPVMPPDVRSVSAEAAAARAPLG